MKNLKIKIVSLLIMVICIPAFFVGCNKDDVATENSENGSSRTVSTEKDANSTQQQLKDLGFITYAEPSEIPAFEVPGVKEGKFNTDALKGKVTILNFWAPWCPPCRSEMPHLQEFYKEFKDKKDFQLIATAIRTDKESVIEFMSENNYTFPAYIDADISSVGLFVSQGIPVTYILNKDGKIVGAYTGAYNFNSAEFKAVIEGMLK